MAVSLLHKRSATNGAVPTTGTLDVGEIAINTRNAKLFIKDTQDNIVQFCPLNDGDKGDITVSNSGQTFTIDNAAVTVAKISATGTPSSSTYLRGDGAWATPSGGGGSGFTPVRNVYTTTTSGITIPSGATFLRVFAWGGGAGGTGGSLNVAGTTRTGGGGGGAGSLNITQWEVSKLSNTISVTIGAGGTGGGGATTNGNGTNGTSGGTTTVNGTWNGSSMRLGWGANGVQAFGASSGSGGAQGYQGGAGGAGSSTTGGLGSQTSSSAVGFSFTSHGGGGGGGVNSSNAHAAGGASFGSYINADPNIAGGTAGGGNGASEALGRGTDWEYSRAGGGGGGGNNNGSGGNGGNGGYSAGGGGGGAGTNLGTGQTGGNGGNGGGGVVILYWL